MRKGRDGENGMEKGFALQFVIPLVGWCFGEILELHFCKEVTFSQIGEKGLPLSKIFKVSVVSDHSFLLVDISKTIEYLSDLF